jgi:hypothetical protein
MQEYKTTHTELIMLSPLLFSLNKLDVAHISCMYETKDNCFRFVLKINSTYDTICPPAFSYNIDCTKSTPHVQFNIFKRELKTYLDTIDIDRSSDEKKIYNTACRVFGKYFTTSVSNRFSKI